MENQNQSIYNGRKANKGNIWLTFMFFGWSYGSLDQMAKQIFFYLTLGGCGLWSLYVLFTLNSKIKEYNRGIGYEIGMSTDELAKNGLL